MLKKIILLILMVTIYVTNSFGQGTELAGTVTSSEDQMPIIGATVAIDGTNKGTITDVDGKFSIMVEPGELIVISYVGMVTQRVPYTGQTELNVSLDLSTEKIEELVVIGYGTQRRSLVTGSISKLSSDDLVKNQPQRIEQALQGKISGVTIAAEGGSPGAGVTINIRGISSNKNSSPLFIVDGMKTGSIEFLDPADIESVEILKDAASAAIYGAEGGNGVVLITTKTGKPGPAQVSYNAYFGNQYFVDRLEVMDGPGYTTYYQDAMTLEYRARGRNDAYIAGKIEEAGLPPVGEFLPTNTDWLNEITNVAPMSSHNLSVSGGTQNTLYSSSINYDNQDGITGGSKANFNRITARLNIDHKVNDWFRTGVKAIYSHHTRNSLSENNEFGGVYGNALMIDPLTPTVYPDEASINPDYIGSGYEDLFVRNDEGLAFGMSSFVKNEVVNPLAQIQTAQGGYTEDKILAGAFIELEPLNGLKFRSSYDIDLANGMDESWGQARYFHNLNFRNFSDASLEFNRWNSWQFDNVLTYSKSFSEHSVTVMLGSHAEEYAHTRMYGWGKNLIRESYAFSHPAIAENDTVVIPKDVLKGERDDVIRGSSIFGRFSYNYGEKYMINITVRNDNSSRLSPNGNYQRGIFPSASAGWVISREDFWTIEAVSFFKLRYSYGTNGSLGAISPFDYVPLIGFTGNVYTDATGNLLQGANPVKVANEALSWETTAMHNAGIDLRLFNNRLSTTVEYFYKKTSDLLTEAPIPGYVGNNPPEANTGIVVNKGLEVEISYRNREGAFQYEIGGNVSFLDNEVTYYPGGDNGTNLGTGGIVTRIDEGLPIYYFYGYKVDGIWKDKEDIDANNFYTDENGEQVAIQPGAIPGDIRIADVKNDSVINTDDRTYIGSPYPDLTAGFYLSLFFKNFDLSANLVASVGNEVYFGAYRNDLPMPNLPAFFLNEAWSEENPEANFFRPTIASPWNFQHNSLFVQDGSYLKLRNIELGYTIPVSLSEKLQISSFRIYAAVNNAFVATNYKGADPEMGYTNGIQSYGIDRGYYPQARQVLFGVNVSF